MRILARRHRHAPVVAATNGVSSLSWRCARFFFTVPFQFVSCIKWHKVFSFLCIRVCVRMLVCVLACLCARHLQRLRAACNVSFCVVVGSRRGRKTSNCDSNDDTSSTWRTLYVYMHVCVCVCMHWSSVSVCVCVLQLFMDSWKWNYRALSATCLCYFSFLIIFVFLFLSVVEIDKKQRFCPS